MANDGYTLDGWEYRSAVNLLKDAAETLDALGCKRKAKEIREYLATLGEIE